MNWGSALANAVAKYNCEPKKILCGSMPLRTIDVTFGLYMTWIERLPPFLVLGMPCSSIYR
jgi:hypothetical protein